MTYVNSASALSAYEPDRGSVELKRLLWIEDDPKVVRWGAAFLQQHGFAVEIALTGSDGLARAHRGGHDLVILDWRLPEPSCQGADVLRALQAAGMTTPVLVCSGYEEEKAAKQAGADGFYLKPIHGDEWLVWLHRLLGDVPRSAKASYPSLSRRDRAWHQRLLDGDLQVREEIASTLLPELQRVLRHKWLRADPTLIGTIADDALMRFFLHPNAYEPRQSPLLSWLRMVAEGLRLNLVKQEQRRMAHEFAVGDHLPDIAAVLEEARSWSHEIHVLMRACWTPEEQAFVQALRQGETRKNVLAGLLGLATASLEDQHKEIRRALERIRLRVHRAEEKNKAATAPRSHHPE